METSISRRNLLLTAAAMPVAIGGFASTARATRPPVLVELFTSQGCSSCPAADRLAGELAKRNDVVVVSLNVDYWDYLGWKDTLAKPEFTKRQMDYAHSRGDGKVYTPQMVINGAEHVVGSNSNAVNQAVVSATSASVPLNLSADEKHIKVSIANSDVQGEATVWLMGVASQIQVKIERGENAGESITYHRVVRRLTPAGVWSGKATEFALPRTSIMTGECNSCLAVLQSGTTGKVLGIAVQPVSA